MTFRLEDATEKDLPLILALGSLGVGDFTNAFRAGTLLTLLLRAGLSEQLTGGVAQDGAWRGARCVQTEKRCNRAAEHAGHRGNELNRTSQNRVVDSVPCPQDRPTDR